MICDKEELAKIVFKYRKKTKATVKLVEDLYESLDGCEDLSDAFAVCENYESRARLTGENVAENVVEDIALRAPVCRESAVILYNTFMWLPDLPIFEALMRNSDYMTAEEKKKAIAYARERYEDDAIDDILGDE